VSGIIDGKQWLQERVKHLTAQLEADPTDEQRVLVETELEQLRAELGSSRGRFRRWLVWGGRLPG
jgi:hypothetical protein